MLPISRILVGLVLLVLGWRLYRVFVAGIGFLAGLELGPRLLPRQPETKYQTATESTSSPPL